MKTLKLWAGPTIAAALWIAAAGFTIAELATVAPSLRSFRAELTQGREAKRLRTQMQARVP